MRRWFFPLAAVILVACSAFLFFKPSNDGWIQLFNGKDLKDWNIKIAKHNYRENYANTFRVENGMMKVGYEG
ncbi:DUF1080 domain-containing protein, partial [Klebsiella pneumoniae]|nr:DUF1080 domain-containing protein [Klebsiella pneumoniae]